MVTILKEAYASRPKKWRGGRKKKLTMENRLLMTLKYLRQYVTQKELVFEFKVGEATVCDTIKWVEDTLVTNFYLRKLTVDDYKAIYFMRSFIETKFDIVKNKIHLENFTGRTVEAISQDFYTCMYLTNIAAIFKDEADEEIHEQRKDKNNKYEYQANTNEIVGAFKDRFIFEVTETSPAKRKILVDQIFDEIKQAVVPIRPNRSFSRPDSVRKMKHYHNQKNNA